MHRRAFLILSASLALAACGGGGLGGIGPLGGGSSGGSGGGGGGTGGSTPPSSGSIAYNLQRVNELRALVGAPALVIDTQLNDFAQAGSEELSLDHLPHQHFITASSSGSMFTTDGFHATAGENQGDPNGWPAAATVEDQIEEILMAMWAEGPGTGSAHGHYENLVNPAFTRLGVGLLVDPSGKLYFTNDFSG